MKGIGIGIFNDNIDENQTTTNHHGLQDQRIHVSLLARLLFNYLLFDIWTICICK